MTPQMPTPSKCSPAFLTMINIQLYRLTKVTRKWPHAFDLKPYIIKLTAKLAGTCHYGPHATPRTGHSWLQPTTPPIRGDPPLVPSHPFDLLVTFVSGFFIAFTFPKYLCFSWCSVPWILPCLLGIKPHYLLITASLRYLHILRKSPLFSI